MVIKMQAVVEVPSFDTGSPPPWPVAPMAARSWLALAADCTDPQVGLFVAALAHRLDVAVPGGRDEVVDTLLTEEFLIVSGGLRLVDTVTGTAVVPGCCAGLEDWRDWAQAVAGGSPWLGHDPGPEIEVVGDDLRVWQEGGPDRERGRWARTKVLLPRDALPGLLMDVHRELRGFLAALDAWATRIGLGERGDALVATVDRHFSITAPWELPAVSNARGSG
ncbi:hypothetical protein ACIBSW_18725 [Actinoplanes sp. NPDC049668]|uniref:hypothetical protein n=1 Tax=unclassified Actinoplanes TaxID=2626549 RepID=UPI0033A50301